LIHLAHLHAGLFAISDSEEWDSINAMQEVAANRYSGTVSILPIWDLLADEHEDLPLPLGEERYYFLHHADFLKDSLISRYRGHGTGSSIIPPTFKATSVNERFSELCEENKSAAAKIALQVSAAAYYPLTFY
jgi:hypothetical protein